MKISEKIRALREEKQWSQEEMAAKLDMSRNGYAKIELGKTKPNIDKLLKIAQLLDVEISDLFQADEKNVLVFMNSENLHENIQQIGNYYRDSADFAAEQEKLLMIIQHKDEIIAQQNREWATLEKLVTSLELRLKEQ